VGHVPQTAAIGSVGNAVIAGHRSYTDGEHFNRLGEAQTGDIIRYVSIEGVEMLFEVDEILEIVPGDQTAFEQPEDRAMITLYTCTPIRTASHRLLVRATRVD
jgi:sortase A